MTELEWLPDLVECTFLVPLARNTDKKPHSATVWQALERALYESFGGSTGPERIYRSVSGVPGSYQDDDGALVHDESFRYIVALPRGQFDRLRAVLRRVANSFDQECIYLCKSGGEVEFVRATEDDGYLE
jgi:hypothetical protein